VAGGNAVRDILGGPMGVPAGADSSLGGAPATAAATGTGTTVGRIQLSISLLFLGSIIALVLLHRVGFRFSVTVG
jgi:hypothetical protein